MQYWITQDKPAVILAPMEGVTDYPMRALMSAVGAFSFCVTEFYRISQDVPASKVFKQHAPELLNGGLTSSGVPVQIQLLGGCPERLAASAARAVEAGATAIDLNFGCPAPTVNNNDGGATLLKFPDRIFKIVSAVRAATPKHMPVSAKLRLGWENPKDIFTNAEQACLAGASWITIHARTRLQGYKPPVFWQLIGDVRKSLSIPVVANGDIWSLEDLKRCQELTGAHHFMLGRGALADPMLSIRAAAHLGLPIGDRLSLGLDPLVARNWAPLLKTFEGYCAGMTNNPNFTARRFKQWVGNIPNCNPLAKNLSWISAVRQAPSLESIYGILAQN